MRTTFAEASTPSNDETAAGERHDIQANDGSFASPVLRPGETWTYTFAQEGYYAYYCSLHQNMEAAILIVPPDESN